MDKATAKIVARVPLDVKTWLQGRAAETAATIGAEFSRICREAMRREAGKDRAIVGPTSE
jgi:hypothetical protein